MTHIRFVTALHLLLALGWVLTGTLPGVAAGALILFVLAARELARHRMTEQSAGTHASTYREAMT
jgi:hypothetical protein